MAERDTFVTIADGDQLSEGYFNGIQPEIDTVNGSVTFDYLTADIATSSATYQDALDVTSAATNFDGQNVLIEASINGDENDPNGCIRIYDVTNSNELQEWSLSETEKSYFYIGKVAVTTSGNTLNIKIQVKGDGVDAGRIYFSSLKLTLIPN